jgi:hypothetical protein
MCAQSLHDREPPGSVPKGRRNLISPDFLRILALVSVIPSYLIGGGLIGFLLDRLSGTFHTFPFMTTAGLLVALVFAVRDTLRLRSEFRGGRSDERSE